MGEFDKKPFLLSIITTDLLLCMECERTYLLVEYEIETLNPNCIYVQAVAGSPLAQARNLAVTCGVNAGISCVLRRLRGKEDVQSR